MTQLTSESEGAMSTPRTDAMIDLAEKLMPVIEQLKRDLSAAERERDEALERNKRLTDGCQRLSAALSRIDYLCGEPNEYETSFYDMHMDECAVVTNVETLRKERDEARAECATREHEVAEVNGLLADVRKDAERYRWLRNHMTYSVRLITDDESGLAVRYRRWYHDSNELHVFTIDEAIDAARRAG